MAEVAELKTTMPELEAEAKAADEELDDGARRDPEPAARRGAGRRRRARQRRSTTCFGAKRDYGVRAEAAFRARRSARRDGFRGGGKALRRALRRAEEGARAARARARAVHARPAHRRARLHRDQAAAAGARRGDVRHRRSCRNSRTISSGRSGASCSRRPIGAAEDRASRPDPDRRSAAHQPRPRIHPRRGSSCRCASPR